MADTRLKDLTKSGTDRVSGYSIPVDHTDLSTAERRLISEIAPLVSENTAYSGTVSKADYIRVNSGGVDYKETIENLLKVINGLTQFSEYSEGLDNSLFPIYDSVNDAIRKISLANIFTNISNVPQFATAVDARATATAFSNAMDARITAATSSLLNQELRSGATTYGYLSLQKFGYIIVGQVKITKSTSGAVKTIDNFSLATPTNYCPSDINATGDDVALCFYNNLDTSANQVEIYLDGTIKIKTAIAGIGTGNCISFNYLSYAI